MKFRNQSAYDGIKNQILGINRAKDVQDFHTENFRHHLKKF